MRSDRSLQGKRRVYARGWAKFKTADSAVEKRKSDAQALSVKSEAGTNNGSVTDKEFVIELLRRLPDDITIYDIAQKLEFVAAVRQGLADLDAGRSVSIEQIERDLASWSVTVGHKRKRQKRKAGDLQKSPAPRAKA